MTQTAKFPLKAADLEREQVASLMSWCDYQRESYWDAITLQGILDLWHVADKWDYEDLESMLAAEIPEAKAACKAYNKALRKYPTEYGKKNISSCAFTFDGVVV